MNASPKNYRRTDLGSERRLGFIAQELEQHLPSEWTNLVWQTKTTTEENQTLFEDFRSLDYSRLVCVLWKVVQSQEARIAMLENKRKK